MHLVDRHRRAPRVACRARAAIHSPSVQVKRLVSRDDRGGRRPQLGGEAERVGLERQQSRLPPEHLVLVERALADPGHEDLPDAAVDALAHRVAAAVPGVEIADHRDARGVRRPDGEMHAVDAFVDDQVRAEPVVEPDVRALDQQIVVDRAEHRAEGVGIVDRPAAALVARPQQVADARGQDAFEEATVVAAPSVTSGAPSRASTSTLRAPGTKARTSTRPPLSCGPSTAKGSPCCPATMAAIVSRERVGFIGVWRLRRARCRSRIRRSCGRTRTSPSGRC